MAGIACRLLMTTACRVATAVCAAQQAHGGLSLDGLRLQPPAPASCATGATSSFPSLFMQITCDRGGKGGRMLNEVHAPPRQKR